jgi:hypothetical protein
MWRRECCLIQVVGVEGDNGHLIATSVGKDSCIRPRTQSRIIHPRSIDPSLRKEVSILRGMFSSNRKVSGRAIILLLPHHHIFQRISVTLYILNLLQAQLFDRYHLFLCQFIFMADLYN